MGNYTVIDLHNYFQVLPLLHEQRIEGPVRQADLYRFRLDQTPTSRRAS
jgi:hypothetical protein